MYSRSWPVLMLGFGALVVVLALFGFITYYVSRQIQRETNEIYNQNGRRNELMSSINTEIHQFGAFVRDYLLDPSPLSSESYRQRLREIQNSLMAKLDELDRLLKTEDAAPRNQLRSNLRSYINSMEPLFEWTPQERKALGNVFLRKHVLPRRNAVMEMTQEVADLNANSFHRQEQLLSQQYDAFRRFIKWMMLAALFLGASVATLSIFRVFRLEAVAQRQHERTVQAEQELRRLSQQLVQAQEEERKSISRDLHDEVGQHLTALRMELGSLEQLKTAPQERFLERLNEIKSLAEETLRGVRDMAMGLRPSMLDELGLEPAVEWQAREFSRRSGLPVSMQIDGQLEHLSEPYRTCIYRVVQEALTNCARHAKAQTVRIAVHGRPDRVFFTVQDDGIGFEVDAMRIRGLGLIGMEERARELGGTVSVHSQPGKGTLVQVEIPIKNGSLS